MNINLTTNQSILLFAILFIIVGWTVPVSYVTFAPQSEFLEIHDFTVDDANVSDEKHRITFDRTVHKPSSAEVTVELIRTSSDPIVEIDSYTVDAYFNEGRREIIIPRRVRDPPIQCGEYKYVHTVELNYLGGLVTRQFTYDSDSFTVDRA